MRKVYVIDYETLSPIGIGANEHLEGLLEGRSGGAYVTQFDASSFPTTFACEVKGDLSPIAKLIHPVIRATFPYDRKAELFCCCAELLSQRAASRLSAVSPNRIGVYVGAGMEALSLNILRDAPVADAESVHFFHAQNASLPHVNKLLNPADFYALHAAAVFNAQGQRRVNLSACAASTLALGEAFRAINSGQCDAAVVGGVDSTVTPFVFAAFLQLNMISSRNDSPKTASRPFDRMRDGFVPGEGAGLVILANDKIAEKLGEPQAQVQGFGSSLDAYKITAPHPQGAGAVLSMERALKSASWSPDTVDYINAHGTSTPLNDPAEACALKTVFGDTLDDIFVSSTKSQIGHLIAAGGIVEFISTVMGIRHGFLPPSINVTKQDPACPVKLVNEPGKRHRISRAISNSFALAGQNATLCVSAVE